MDRNLYNVVGNGTWLQDFVSLLNSQITVPHMYVHMRHVELKIVMTTNSHMAFILCLILSPRQERVQIFLCLKPISLCQRCTHLHDDSDPVSSALDVVSTYVRMVETKNYPNLPSMHFQYQHKAYFTVLFLETFSVGKICILTLLIWSGFTSANFI